MIERRRSLRCVLPTGEAIRVELRQRVRVIDISESGALIACESEVPRGARGHFHGELAMLPFGAEVTVRREHDHTGEARLGVQFGSMDPNSRRHLEQFLRRAKE